VLFLAVDGWLAGWVVGDEGYASARFFLSMVRMEFDYPEVSGNLR
jgi:hypothetical protein